MTLLPESVAMVELAASYVAGKWVSGAHTATLDVTSPTTGELLGTVGVAGREEARARGAEHDFRGRHHGGASLGRTRPRALADSDSAC